jgi:ribosomal protein L12E/L44/L45/RPP1/RPP2
MMNQKNLNLELLNVAAMMCILTEQEVSGDVLELVLRGLGRTVSKLEIQFYMKALSPEVLQEMRICCSRRGEVTAAETTVVAPPVQSAVEEKSTVKPKTEEEDLDLFF